MADAPAYHAKAMKPVDIYAMKHGSTDTTPQFRPEIGEMTRPPNMPKKGSDPAASMFDGPYGGKKPQS